jgi:CHAT domain-containing protein
MGSSLDLNVTITRPSPGTSFAPIADVTLQCDALGLASTGTLLTDLLTEEERSRLRWYLEEYLEWPYEVFEQRAKQVEALLPELGKRLYEAVFGDPPARDIIQQWWQQQAQQRQITIISDIASVLSLPWELLYDERGFLTLRSPHPVAIVRRLQQRELLPQPAPFQPPLRILLVTARPDDAGFIDPRSSARELLEEVKKDIEAGAIELEFLRPPTFDDLHQRLKDTARPIHVLHFDGHGALLKGKGVLAFENSGGLSDRKEAEEIAGILQGSGVRLVVLDACQSALGRKNDAFSSVAAQLIQSGIDAVVAMSASVLATSMARYVEAFYRALASGVPVSTAHLQAQQALAADPRRYLLRRRRDDEGEPVKLYDWWVPHFYQLRPLTLQPVKSEREDQQRSSTPAPGSGKGIFEAPNGFVGRTFELLTLERHLIRQKLVVIYGFGGVGKTAFVREAAQWLTQTGMYTSACVVSFEHGGNAATLLNELRDSLRIYDDQELDDPLGALQALKGVLREQRVLVIAESVESILPGGEARLERDTRIELWKVLLKLREMGAGVVLTTRDSSVGDGYLQQHGYYTAYLLLKGLQPDDAWLLATSLLQELKMDRTRFPYAEGRDFLGEQLGHHPLSIRLVLPALHEKPLAQIKADFAALLPDFVDRGATGCNQSLVASLEYSLRRLSEEQRQLLPRLVLFERGMHEGGLLAITKISESEWKSLGSALERAALLTVEVAEFADEGVETTFLLFHPTLIPYLRRTSDSNDERLREDYVAYYYDMALQMSLADDRLPRPVHTLIRWELPNLRHALTLLLDSGQLEAAVDMANNVTRFLNIFELREERDALRQQVAKTLDAAEAQSGGAFTYARHFFECGVGEEELEEGKPEAARARFEALLTAIEARSESEPLGRGSYEHCVVLRLLARSLGACGQPAAAEVRLREALTVLDARVKRTPNSQQLLEQLQALLAEFGNVPLKYVIQARGRLLMELGVLPQVTLLRSARRNDEQVNMPLARFVQRIKAMLNEQGNVPLKQLERERNVLLFELRNVRLTQGRYL